MKRKRTHKALKIALLVIAVLVLLCAAALCIYANDYYHADAEAAACIATPEGGVTVTQEGRTLVFTPAYGTATGNGLIFYPGGKVEYTAYAPLLERLAEHGVLCVLVKMPFNLAVLDTGAADGIAACHPEVTDWYIGGHSLGGVCAAIYVSEHTADFTGLVLLAAYSQQDLSDSGLRVLSIYGENDGVLQRDEYEANRGNLPADTTELVIPGGCHAYFGNYGAQEGDGTPTITADEQQAYTADAILALMG